MPAAIGSVDETEAEIAAIHIDPMPPRHPAAEIKFELDLAQLERRIAVLRRDRHLLHNEIGAGKMPMPPQATKTYVGIQLTTQLIGDPLRLPGQ
ncbi:ribonuclease bn [Lasius niger]|uniref:Ribonuclease bn n=1 Tax=Lasius niger TaxID=67767 RepID=A0A0J7K4K0_LASNI|nr:ribonuclease bn [Lasius niger]